MDAAKAQMMEDAIAAEMKREEVEAEEVIEENDQEDELREGEDIEDELDTEFKPVTLGMVEELEDDEEINRFDFQSKAGKQTTSFNYYFVHHGHFFSQTPSKKYHLTVFVFVCTGGRPAWLNPTNAPTAEQLTNVRGEVLDFLCQIYAPLGEDDEGGSVDTFHRMLYVFVARSGAPAGCSSCLRVFRCQMPRKNDFYPFEPPQEDDPEPEEPFADSLCVVSGLRTTNRCAEMGNLPYATTEHQQLHWKMTKNARSKAKKAGKEYIFTRPSWRRLADADATFPEHAIENEEEPDGNKKMAEDNAKMENMMKNLEVREGEEGQYKVSDFAGWRDTFQPDRSNCLSITFFALHI